MAKASGTVYRSGTRERIPAATIKVVKGGKILYATTNDDGDFNLDIPEPGTWDFVALDEESFPNQPRQVDMSGDQSDIGIYLNRISGEVDEKAGKTTFWVLLGVLGGLIILYLALHLFLFEDVSPLSEASLESLVRSKQQLAASQVIEQDEALQVAIADLESDLQVALSRTNQLNTTDRQFVSEVLQSIDDAVATGQRERVFGLLDDLQQVIDPQPSFTFWSSDPLRFLEILLWGLAGILVNKIIMIGWYLRSHRFYQEGVLMHIGHIATTPILVLITVLILSLVTLTFTLTGGNEIAVDLSDPRIMVAFAFIIGTSPWPLWRFIENAAKRFTSQFD